MSLPTRPLPDPVESLPDEAAEPADGYRLLDFGGGRRLERFGPYIVDRPAPVATADNPQQPGLWSLAHARYDATTGGRGEWAVRRPPPDEWRVRFDRLWFELKLTPFGHVGLFPEQQENWRWVAQRTNAAGRPLRVLNLFAYTGGSTLAAASAGAAVTHIDSARNTIAWARRNSGRSGLDGATIRWITEDASKFVRREIRRGKRYDAVILDPPSYGHGPRGEVWRLDRHLVPLLSRCFALIREQPEFMLFTCHSTGYDLALLEQLMRGALPRRLWTGIESQVMQLVALDGRRLPAGYAVRWARG